jgi:hypothetical protein
MDGQTTATNAAEPMVTKVFAALLRGELNQNDLTARRISSWLGQSTIGLYHYFGSLDGFLIRIDGAGWRHLLELLQRKKRAGADFTGLALAYLDFARAHPALYGVIAERHFDRARLRKEGRLRAEATLLAGFGALLEVGEDETLLVFATLHGLASLEASGRVDLGGGRRGRERIEGTLRSLARAFVRPGRAHGNG